MYTRDGKYTLSLKLRKKNYKLKKKNKKKPNILLLLFLHLVIFGHSLMQEKNLCVKGLRSQNTVDSHALSGSCLLASRLIKASVQVKG